MEAGALVMSFQSMIFVTKGYG